ncbi:MAG: ATP-dependent protease ATPase subunit HslU [Armatimonadota bacterium]|nr:MAG: ATP-dependent protease ATPase subunit HslU [Armatimonadota bacterium]
MAELTPRRIVEELNRYIIGQEAAKRAVAVALRNRHRRRRLEGPIREEVIPKNILMIGPTGVGKTEIARRLSRLAAAPFVKVEATKFTEVGYVGRDVEAIIRELADVAVRMVQSEKMREVEDRAGAEAIEEIVEALRRPRRPRAPKMQAPLDAVAAFLGQRPMEQETETPEAPDEEAETSRAHLRQRVEDGGVDDEIIEIEVEESKSPFVQIFSPAGMEEMGMNLQDMLGGMMPKAKKQRRVTVAEAKEILTYQRAQALIDMDQVTAEAIEKAEESGIVFVDELDKIAGRETGHGPEVSREGVQRDILPIVEGSTVMTKYGPVRTDHMLFIAAGAFHISKPSDLIPELQGRLPLRVELTSLGADDFVRILTEPENSLIKQYCALLAIEGVELDFTDDGVSEIARIAGEVNERTENIGARRLHTVMERLLEQVSFDAPDIAPVQIVIDPAYVRQRLADLAADADTSRYIL